MEEKVPNSRAKSRLSVVFALAMLGLVPGSLPAAPLTEIPSPSPSNPLVRSMLAEPRLEPPLIFLADEFTFESAPQSLCGDCDLRPAAESPPVDFAPPVSDVPEPSTLFLAVLGLSVLLWIRRSTFRASVLESVSYRKIPPR